MYVRVCVYICIYIYTYMHIYNLQYYYIQYYLLQFYYLLIYSSDSQPPIDLDCLGMRVSNSRPRGARQDRMDMFCDTQDKMLSMPRNYNY